MALAIGRKERKTQLYFSDDNKFQFIKREVQYSCLVEKIGDTLKRAWKHFYGNQYFFAGYKKMSADTVTLGFARDIILDPFNKVPVGESVGEKPRKDKVGMTKWIAKIAENQRHTFRSKRQNTKTNNIINISLSVVLIIMILVWAITYVVRLYG